MIPALARQGLSISAIARRRIGPDRKTIRRYRARYHKAPRPPRRTSSAKTLL